MSTVMTTVEVVPELVSALIIQLFISLVGLGPVVRAVRKREIREVPSFF